MLYVCYGAKKTGSSYVHNLTKALLEAAGHPHVRIPPEVRQDPKPPKNEWANIVRETDESTVDALRAFVPEGRIVTLRTHSAPSPALIDLVKSGDGELQVTIRDPRDVALSYMDVYERKLGKVARRADDVGSAKKLLEKQIEETFRPLDRNVKFATAWIDCGAGPLIVNYETAAFEPLKTIEAICLQLNLSVPREKWDAIYQEADSALHSKKNVARAARHVTEMPEDVQASFLSRYDAFYKRFFPDAKVQADQNAVEATTEKRQDRLGKMMERFGAILGR